MTSLSEFQKYQLITILRDLASVDHNIDLLEAVRIRLIGLKMDLHADKIDEALYDDLESMDSIKKRLEHFHTEEQQKFLYQQCVLLIASNREISPEEQSAMQELREALRLDEDFHHQIMAWCQEGIEWEKRGEMLVGMDPAQQD
ncbi:MAG: hypothetical protein JXR73_05470 [Candidatus Omnitrophica bacterium]|nr:hypothetical protein [Candidatus Omnitrophota bacterium]